MNIVLAEVRPDLHLEDLDGNFVGVLQPMPLRRKNVDAFVLAHELLFIATRFNLASR